MPGDVGVARVDRNLDHVGTKRLCQATAFEGIDILGHVAQGRRDFHRTLYWRKPRGETIWKGVRQGTLKYVGRKRGDRTTEYLFDLAGDPAEKQDLKGQRPADFEKLKKLYHTWEAEVRKNRR